MIGNTQQQPSVEETLPKCGEAVYLAPNATFSGNNSVSFIGERYSRTELAHAVLHHEQAYYPLPSGSFGIPATADMEYCVEHGFLKPYRIASPFALLGGTISAYGVESEFRNQVIIGFKALRRKLGPSLVIAPSYSNFDGDDFSGRSEMGVQWEIQASLPLPAEDSPIQDWFEARELFHAERGRWMHKVAGILPAVLGSETPERTLEIECFDLASEYLRLQRIADRQGVGTAEVTLRVVLEVGQETTEALSQLPELFGDPGVGTIQALGRIAQAGVRIKQGVMKVRDERKELYSSPLAYPVLYLKHNTRT